MAISDFKPTVIIPVATGARGPVPFAVTQENLPVTITSTSIGSATTEAGQVMFSVDGGVTYENLIQNGDVVEFNNLRNSIVFSNPILLGLTKGVTANNVGVFAFSTQKVGL